MRESSASQILIQVRGVLLKYAEYPADNGVQPFGRCLLRRGETVGSCFASPSAVWWTSSEISTSLGLRLNSIGRKEKFCEQVIWRRSVLGNEKRLQES